MKHAHKVAKLPKLTRASSRSASRIWLPITPKVAAPAAATGTGGRRWLLRPTEFESHQHGGPSVEAMEFDDQQPWEQLTLAELTELLEELTELDFSESEVAGIRNLAMQLGSLEEALELIVAQGEQGDDASLGREAA